MPRLSDLPDLDDAPDDVIEEQIAERQRRARMRHWCRECRGWPGGPCDFDEPEPTKEIP